MERRRNINLSEAVLAGDADGIAGIPARRIAPPSSGVRAARWAYWALAWLLVGCLLAQVLFAGMAVFVDPARWGWHTTLVHTFQYGVLIMLALAFAGRLPAAARWLTGALIALIAAQYVTANIGGLASAFHPLSGFLMLWIAVNLGQRAWRAARA